MNLWQIEGIQYFLALLPVVAFLYAAVGHGGASGYLALMALWSFPVSMMKPTALMLNLFVAAVSFVAYARQGHFDRRLFMAFALTSVPMAFLGGMVQVDAAIYRKVLAVLLVFAIVRMLVQFGEESLRHRTVPFRYGMLAGAVIGLFSGMIGIGGGIILSPLILLMRWGTMKQAAAVSAAFIWVNSAAGLAGHFSRGVSLPPQTFLLVGGALIGGMLGGHFGSVRMNDRLLTRILAAVLLVASVKLFFTA